MADVLGPIFPLTPLVLGDFSAVNQGSATATTEGNGVHVHDPTTDSNINYRIWKKSYTAPKAVKVLVLPKLLYLAFQHCGVGFFDNSNLGRVSRIIPSDGNGFRVTTINSPTSDNANEALLGEPMGRVAANGPYIWLGLEDDNTNCIFSWSSDGQHFQKVFSVGRTSFVTPTGWGFFVNSRSGQPCGMTILSWEEGTSLTYT